MIAKISIYWKQNGYPILHGSIDNSSWIDHQINSFDKGVYSLQIKFNEDIKFVICNSSKTNWYNPHKQLSDSSSYIQQNGSTNYIINKSGQYIIINSIMTLKQPSKIQQLEELIVINIDGVLIGDQLSLLHFNTLWMSIFYESKKYKLVYMTGRSIQDVFKLQSIILPQYLICEGGSYIYQSSYKQQYPFEYKQISINTLSQQQIITLKQLTNLGFFKLHAHRHNSYAIQKHFLISNNQHISQFLDNLTFQYGMVQQTQIVYFDFFPKGINKYQSVLTISKTLSNPKIITFGSNLSDYQLMYYSDICIAPVNSQQRLVKLLQGKIIKSNAQYAETLVQYFQSII